ncbi:uncharacterized protein BJX67DRAFT_60673 [Aspergillus lucknowensis]|uniref:Uncharacterized protein n=1 Tax=Aspergillus lucknowensis TaxID=176173 RepID=A0ABR4LU71_9EURO
MRDPVELDWCISPSRLRRCLHDTRRTTGCARTTSARVPGGGARAYLGLANSKLEPNAPLGNKAESIISEARVEIDGHCMTLDTSAPQPDLGRLLAFGHSRGELAGVHLLRSLMQVGGAFPSLTILPLLSRMLEQPGSRHPQSLQYKYGRGLLALSDGKGVPLCRYQRHALVS